MQGRFKVPELRVQPCGLLVLIAALLIPLLAYAQSNEVFYTTQTQTSTQSSSITTAPPSDLTPPPDTYHLHGVVLDSHTGKPIARALVQAFGDRLATMTDRDGRFTLDVHFTSSAQNGGNNNRFVRQVLFPNLAARKPGYTTNFSARRMQPTQLSALDKDIVLKLTPESSIEGRVIASGDDHPENVRVMLFSRQMQNGYARWMQTGGASTKSNGEFRIGGLAAGEYKLMTQQWSGQPAQPIETGRPRQLYAPVRYPAGSTSTSGPSFHLGAGEVLPINLNLHAETFYPVRIPVVVGATNTNGGLQVRVNSGGGAPGFTMRYNSRDRTVEGVLPAGTYEVIVQSNGPDPSAATVPLTVHGGPAETAPITLVPLATIPVVVHQDFTSKQSEELQGVLANAGPPVSLVLMSDDPMTPTPNLNAFDQRQKNELALEHVLPGTYHAEVNAMRGYVAAVSCGGTNLLREPLVVSPGSTIPPIEITMRDDTGTVRGTVDIPADSTAEDDSNGASGFFILFLPVDAAALNLPNYLTHPDGTLYAPNIPPGSYHVFASREPFNQMDFRSEAFMKRNGSKAAIVTVQAGETVNFTLSSLVEEEQ